MKYIYNQMNYGKQEIKKLHTESCDQYMYISNREHYMQLTIWSRILLEKLKVTQPVKKTPPPLYGT